VCVLWCLITSQDRAHHAAAAAQENRCALYAMQAVTLIAGALAKLEAGDLSVAAFGSAAGTRVLHPLSAPWNDTAAQHVLGQLHFDADNTLRETPVLDMVRTVGALLQRAGAARGAAAAASALSQLLLIVADGHFHERDALARAVRETSGAATGGNGLLIVFIILDTDHESVLELQSVSFEDGKPVFKRYLDAFPFPYYLVLRDIEHLPRLLADVLRQWLALCVA
jgi:midasin